jgi:putative membrane protein
MQGTASARQIRRSEQTTNVVDNGSTGSRHRNPHRNGHIVLATLALAGPAAHFVGPWVGGFGFLFLLIPLFWIALFAVIFSIARRRRASWFAKSGAFGQPTFGGGHSGGHWVGPSSSAESTLGERFAQGDIDEKDYRARLEVLRANAWPQPPAK